MPSIDFDIEKLAFRDFYDERRDALHASLTSFQTLISSLLQGQPVAVSSVEGRVKDWEECIRKFTRKYRTDLES